MEYKIKKLSTNRFKINGFVYKRIKSGCSCIGCHFYNNECMIDPMTFCSEIQHGKIQYYHLIPKEL